MEKITSTLGEEKDSVPPVNWRIVRLGDMADIQAGGNAPQGRQYFAGGNLPFVRVQHFDGNSKHVNRWDLITEEAVKHYRLQKFPAGSILLPKSGASINLEKRAILARDSYVVSHLAILRGRPEVCDGSFLYYALRTLSFAASSAGAVLPFLNLSNISDKAILLPPLTEQRAIAAVLARLQAAVERREQIVGTLEEIRRATLCEFLRRGRWPLERLEDIAESISYGTSIRSTPEEGGLPILRIPNVIHGRIDTSNLKYAALSKSEITRWALRDGDLLFVRTNGSRENIGRSAVFHGIPKEALFASYLLRVRVDVAKILPDFLQAFLMANGREQIVANARPAADGKFNINTGTLENVTIPCPPIDKQEELVRIARVLDRRLELGEAELRIARQLFTSTVDSLMSGRLRV